MNERVKRLEEKIAHLEHHVAEQDRAMLEMGEDLGRLRRELLLLRTRISQTAPDGGEELTGEGKPPHY